jgi:hypothetical protein
MAKMAALPLLLLVLGQATAADLPEAIEAYLRHAGFTWNCEAGGHFQFCWEASLASNANMATARSAAESDREQVLAMMNLPPVYEPRIYVFFVASPRRMKELIGYEGEGRSRPAQHAVFFVPTPIRPSLRHELTHEILTNLWGAAEAWIEEGMATFVAYSGQVSARSVTMTEDGVMLPLGNLVREEWNPAMYPLEVTYDELAGFVEYLIRKYGLERVKAIWQGGSESIPKVTEKTVRALEADWRAELERAAAARGKPHEQGG